MLVPSPPLLWTIACLFAVLTVGTLVRIALLGSVVSSSVQSHLNSTRTWWALAASLSIATLLGEAGVVVLLAIAGILSLREYLQLVGWKAVGAPTAVVVFASVPIYYAIALCGYDQGLLSTAPLAFLFVLGTLRAWLGLIEDYIRTTAAMIWGLMLFVYCLSHASFLLTLPATTQPWVGNVGWFLYLVILTETNDIAQALVGRRFGETKISPRISPNKSLEGLLGGIALTILLAVLLASSFTTLMHVHSRISGIFSAMLAGLLIALSGFLGDLNKSGIKRDVGVKDSGTILPGQGGMMDRIDSLTFSAPVFYYFVRSSLTEN